MTALYNACRIALAIAFGAMLIVALHHSITTVKLPTLEGFVVICVLTAIVTLKYWYDTRSLPRVVHKDDRVITYWSDGRVQHQYSDGTVVVWNKDGTLLEFSCADFIGSSVDA